MRSPEHGRRGRYILAAAPPAWGRKLKESIVSVRQVSFWWQTGLLAVVYFAAAKASLLFAIPPGYATAVWPPSGIALAAMLLLGPRHWPGVWIGAALANEMVEFSALSAGLIATGNTLEALLGAALTRRYIGTPRRFERSEDVVKFIAIATVSAMVAATVALAPLGLRHSLPWPEMLWNWWTWWLGDATGIILVVPLILSWRHAATVVWSPPKLLEGLCFGLLLLAGAQLVFGTTAASATAFPRAFVIIPFMIWAALRFGQREVTTAIAAVCALAIWHTVQGRGPFASAELNEALLLLLAFVSTMVATGLVLSAALDERRRAMEALRERHDQLDARVRERTAELERAVRVLKVDIAARARAEKLLLESEAELIAARATAENASSAKSEFLAKMSHELRTPLNSLMILAKLLADNADRNLLPKQVQYAKVIHEAGADLLALINDILDLSRIEAGATAPLQIAPVSLARLGDYVELTFRQVAQDRALRFEVSIEGLPPEIETDEQRVQQILKNLLSNAFKFTKEGSVRLHIAPVKSGWAPGSARLDSAAQVAAFSVTDSGIGVPDDKQAIIFEAFQQADGSTSREYGGTGLGLSISRDLARMLGGQIGLESTRGKGSTFTLYLPVNEGWAF